MVERKDVVNKFVDGKGAVFDGENELKVPRHKEKEATIKKPGKDSDLNAKISRGNTSEKCQPTVGTSPVLQILNTEGANAVETVDEDTRRNDEIIPMKNSKVKPYGSREIHGLTLPPSVSDTSSREPKPLLKLKFKNLYVENWTSWVSQGEERNSVKGQRSKRKRPSPLVDKVGCREGVAYTDLHQENMAEEVMDANWILQKLGKDAIGKRVEIHRQSDSSWHKGVVSDVIEGTSSLLVRLDDGGNKTLELGKQSIRFISQKKRMKL